MKKGIYLAVAAVMMTGCLTGCGGSDDASKQESKLIGTWIKESGRTSVKKIIFYEGGNCAVDSEMGTWSVSGSTLSILGTYGGQFWAEDAMIGTFSVNDDTLTLIDVNVDGDIIESEIIYKKSNNK